MEGGALGDLPTMHHVHKQILVSVPRIKGILYYYYHGSNKGYQCYNIMHVIKKYCALTSVINNSENQKNYGDKVIIIIMHVIKKNHDIVIH